MGTLLVDTTHVPHWVREPYILTGYRPTPTRSLTRSMRQLFVWHNETVNIATHAFASLFFFVASVYIQLGHTTLDGASLTLRILFGLYTLTASMTFAVSATYHQFLIYSEQTYVFLRRMDLTAIVLFVGTSFMTPLWIVFRCNGIARAIYVSVILVLTMMTIHVLLSDDQQRWKNVLLFTSLAAFGVLPMVHASFVLPLQSTLCPLPPPMQVIDLIYSAQPVIANAHHRVNLMLLCMYALYALGGVLYLVRIPEKLYPGLFDRMGHSHQLMHVFVMAAAMLQLWIVLDLNQWASTVPCCNQ